MMKRILIAGSFLGVLAVVAMGVWAFNGGLVTSVDAQVGTVNTSNMQQRLDQTVKLLNGGGAAGAGAIDEAMEILYGGFRVLPTAGDENTELWHRQTSANEMQLAQALQNFATKANRQVAAEDVQRAVDMKLFIEQMNDVANTLAFATRQCQDGSTVAEGPCEQLQPLLNEANGVEAVVGRLTANLVIRPGYTVKLRGPFLPRPTTWWQETVEVVPPLAWGECAVVFKETKGLMLKVCYDRIITVSDPWATPQLPRGTQIPVWRMEWVPSEYVKTFNYCNNEGKVTNTVDMKVVQDTPLKYFWTYYHR